MHRALGTHRPALGLGDQAQGLDVTPQGRTSLHEPTGAQEPWRKMVTACLRPLDDCTKAPPLSALLALLAAPGLRLHAFIHALLPGTAAPPAAASPGSHPGARLPVVSPPCSQLLSLELLALRSRTCPSPSPSSPNGPRQCCP